MANEPLADKQIVCVDCGAQFLFTGRDQAFYQERGYQHPRRCKACRDKRKSGGNATGGGGGSGGWGGGGGHSQSAHSARPAATRGQSETEAEAQASMAAAAAGVPEHAQFKVICSGCGVESTVPFKPDPNRPVYYRNCYIGRRKAGPKP